MMAKEERHMLQNLILILKSLLLLGPADSRMGREIMELVLSQQMDGLKRELLCSEPCQALLMVLKLAQEECSEIVEVV